MTGEFTFLVPQDQALTPFMESVNYEFWNEDDNIQEMLASVILYFAIHFIVHKSLLFDKLIWDKFNGCFRSFPVAKSRVFDWVMHACGAIFFYSKWVVFDDL